MRQKLSIGEARAAAIRASGIGAFGDRGLAGSLSALRRLGSVQIDTISVVERAHHHILWARNPDYRPPQLSELESEPRRAIEYWSHAAAYIPIEDYRFCLPRMERIREQGHEWFEAEPGAVSLVLDRIKAEGPLRAQDFEGAKGRAGWWDWKPAKRALEYLFHAGELVSVGRRGFQKVYDLADRTLPPSLDLRPPSGREMAARYVDQAVASLGVFAAGEVAYMRKDGIEGIRAELEARLESGALVELELFGDPALAAPPYYAEPSAIDAPRAAASSGEGRVFVLSPFDPLILDRRRTLRLFGRDFQLECYVPAAKRAFGYFALPLLSLRPDGQAEILGLLDAKAERRGSVLAARRLSLDPPPGARAFAGGCAPITRSVAAALREFAAFNGMERVELERLDSGDGRMERSLRAALRRR